MFIHFIYSKLYIFFRNLVSFRYIDQYAMLRTHVSFVVFPLWAVIRITPKASHTQKCRQSAKNRNDRDGFCEEH